MRVSYLSTQDDGVTSLKTCVSVCKLSDWDPEVFLKYRQVILGQVRVLSAGAVVGMGLGVCAYRWWNVDVNGVVVMVVVMCLTDADL